MKKIGFRNALIRALIGVIELIVTIVLYFLLVAENEKGSSIIGLPNPILHFFQRIETILFFVVWIIVCMPLENHIRKKSKE